MSRNPPSFGRNVMIEVQARSSPPSRSTCATTPMVCALLAGIVSGRARVSRRAAAHAIPEVGRDTNRYRSSVRYRTKATEVDDRAGALRRRLEHRLHPGPGHQLAAV